VSSVPWSGRDAAGAEAAQVRSSGRDGLAGPDDRLGIWASSPAGYARAEHSAARGDGPTAAVISSADAPLRT
jgi:hypothetical protein